MIFGFDLATRCTGWCAGAGDARPAVDVFRYAHVEEDLGLLARNFKADLASLEQRFGAPSVVIYEAPLLLPSDRLLPLRKIYGMGMILEEWAQDRGAAVEEVSSRAIKKRITGNHLAEKKEVVRIVREKLRITLPEGKIEEDAADAFGAWLAGGVDHHARQFQSAWDTLLFTGRGGLT